MSGQKEKEGGGRDGGQKKGGRERETVRERERQKFFFTQMATTARILPGCSQELHPERPYRWQGSRHVRHLLLFSIYTCLYMLIHCLYYLFLLLTEISTYLMLVACYA